MVEIAERTFGFVAFPGFEELDLVGPWEMVAMWAAYAGGPQKRVIVAETLDPVLCDKGLSILPTHTFTDCPSLDYLLVPGGFIIPIEEKLSARVIDFVRDRTPSARAVMSVCSGSFILHQAGVLKGRRAATNWKAIELQKQLADVTTVEKRWVRDGSVWTSGGVSAGMDMTLAFIADEGGADAASLTQLHAEYFPDGKIYPAKIRSAGRLPRYLRSLTSRRLWPR